ncbi:MAG: hypothetical protein R2706_06255 [Acidimicrobiales bacterium]
MVSGRGAELFPGLETFRDRLAATTKSSVWLDTAASPSTSSVPQPMANVLLVGAAYQLGVLPVSAGADRRSNALNGVAVDMNIEAFRLGRRLAIDPTS